MFDVENFRAAVGVPKISFHHLARGNHVRHARRDTQIVFQNRVTIISAN